MWILDDGRVLKIAPPPDDAAPGARHVAEISDAAGSVWTSLPDSGLPGMRLDNDFHMFMLEGELFASGRFDGSDEGARGLGLKWFDPATRQWALLWQAGPKDNWRDLAGRMIVRTLANGKRVVIPVLGP